MRIFVINNKRKHKNLKKLKYVKSFPFKNSFGNIRISNNNRNSFTTFMIVLVFEKKKQNGDLHMDTIMTIIRKTFRERNKITVLYEKGETQLKKFK